jgi:hypothetical protein
MIKVTAKEVVVNKDKLYETQQAAKEHKDGLYASVYNGVLTIYNGIDKDSSKPETTNAIAGYMPDSWVSWQKV